MRVYDRFRSIGCGGITAFDFPLRIQVQSVFGREKTDSQRVRFCFSFFFKRFLSKTLLQVGRQPIACLVD